MECVLQTQLAYLSVMDVSWQNNLVKGKINIAVILKMIKCCKICLNWIWRVQFFCLFVCLFFNFFLFVLFCFLSKQVITKWLWKQSLGILRRMWVSWGNYFGRDVINPMKSDGVYYTFQYARTVVVTSTIWRIIILNLYTL